MYEARAWLLPRPTSGLPRHVSHSIWGMSTIAVVDKSRLVFLRLVLNLIASSLFWWEIAIVEEQAYAVRSALLASTSVIIK